MARADWVYIAVSSMLADSIERFLRSEDAKNMELKNKQQFINRLAVDFFRKYGQNTGIDYMKLPPYPGILDLIYGKPKKGKK